MRFARGLRTDLLIIPYAVWTSDAPFRQRLARELRLPRTARGSGGDQVGTSIRAFATRRPVCASMGFEKPPEVRPAVKWNKRPLVWVTGKESKADRVPARDFVFAALRLAIDEHETWTPPAVALYRRAAENVGGLCKAFETFGVVAEVGCR